MGTQGYVVHHYKGYYFVRFYRRDSYPEDLGVRVLSEWNYLSKEDARHRVASTRRKYEKKLAALLADGTEIRENTGDPEDHVTCCRPNNLMLIDWVYEIDLDAGLLSINGHPYFNLDRLPPEDVFLDSIRNLKSDYYQIPAPSRSIPKEYHLCLEVDPPTLSDSELDLYTRHTPAEGDVVENIHDMLIQREALSDRIAVCTRMLEVAASTVMRHEDHLYVTASLLSDRDQYTNQLKNLGRMLIQMAVCPLLYARPSPTDAEEEENRRSRSMDFWWVRKHICVYFATHLNVERNLKGAVSRLLEEFDRAEDPLPNAPAVFGILFSFRYIVIVRYCKGPKTFTHSEPLQFLPDRYASSGSTDGIAALARLGDYTVDTYDDEMFYARNLARVYRYDITDPFKTCDPLPGTASHSGPALPPEILATIASFISDGRDLAKFALTSHQTLYESLRWLKYPQLRVRNLPVEFLILTALGPSARKFIGAPARHGQMYLYSGTFYTNAPLPQLPDQGSESSESDIISVTADGPDREFKAVSTGQFSFSGIGYRECGYAVFRGRFTERGL